MLNLLQDYAGQKLAEKIFKYITVAFGVSIFWPKSCLEVQLVLQKAYLPTFWWALKALLRIFIAARTQS